MAPTSPDASRRGGWKRHLRFRLRTLLVILTLFCVWLGWRVRDARRQEAAMQSVVSVAPNDTFWAQRIEYAHQFTRQGVHDPQRQPIWPNWLLELLGRDLFLRVVGVSFDGLSDASDAELRPLVGLTRLRRLDVEYTGVTDEGLEFISEHFPKLTRLDLQETHITASGLKYLAQLHRLRAVMFGKCEITDEDLAQLEPLHNLEHLALRRTKIRGEGLGHLVALRNLRSLDLDRNPLTDAVIEPLSQMSQLDELTLTGTGISAQSIGKLKSALPKCKIVAE